MGWGRAGIRMDGIVAVVGLGYVGLPLALQMVRSGYRVFGIDVDRTRIEALRRGSSYIVDVTDGAVEDALRGGNFEPVLDFSVVHQAEAVSICVPTPLRKTRDPDLSCVVSAVENLLPHLRCGHTLVLESTTYPGTTEELIRPLVESTGLVVGRDVFLAFSPERVDPGNKQYGIGSIPKVIGGVTPECTRRAVAFYETVFEEVVPVSSARTAEMVKLLENTFRAVNIALVNELAMMCDRMAIDIWEVIRAAATKPFGFMPFYPGPGIGGHCIPLDPVYLSWKAKSYGFYNRFIELATDVNANMPRYVVWKISEVLNLHKKCINGSRILLLGITYKPDVSDTRESPALEILQSLEERGALVDYHDPLAPEVRLGPRVKRSVDLSVQLVSSYDLVVLTTNHSFFDYAWIAAHAQAVFDTRNAFEGLQGRIYTLGKPFTPPEGAAEQLVTVVASRQPGV